MSDEEALLSAIAANPAEDTPRLVYADWLDEHDHHIRSEFIRLQIDIAGKQETLPRALLNRHVDLFKRQQELIDNHLNELLGPLATLPIGTTIEFDRGFISELRLDAERYIALANAITTLRPLSDVNPWDAAARLEVLSNISRHMSLVSALQMEVEFSPYHLNASPVWLHFGECWPWDRLRTLDLGNCRIGNEGLHCLTVGDQNLTRLSEVDLSWNEITDVGLTELIQSPLPGRLRRLILQGNRLSDGGGVALAEGWPTGDADRLEYLNMRYTDIGPRGQQALRERFGERVEL